MKHTSVSFAFLLSVSLTVLHAAAPSAKPNIIILHADDLGYGDVACYNPESRVPTPNLDRLAREGMKFTDAHSASTVCTPMSEWRPVANRRQTYD